MDRLGGPGHAGGSLGSRDGRQSVSIVARVKSSAGEARRTRHAVRAAHLQHVTHLTVEVSVRGQSVEDHVLDSSNGGPEREKHQRQLNIPGMFQKQMGFT